MNRFLCLILLSLAANKRFGEATEEEQTSKTTEAINAPVGNCTNGWGYSPSNGPLKWSQFCEECGKEEQSPIMIRPENVRYKTLLPVTFAGYSKPLSDLSIENTGRTVKINIPDDSGVSIRIPTKPDLDYDLVRIDFHWSDDNHGSEHMIGPVGYPMEIQMVHKNGDNYANLAVFAELHCHHGNAILSNIAEALKRVRTAGLQWKLNVSIKLDELLPKEKERSAFYTYSGSLTAPPCTQSAEWIVFENPIRVKPNMLSAFRWLYGIDGVLLSSFGGVVRPTQANVREVTYSINKQPKSPKISIPKIKSKICAGADKAVQKAKESSSVHW